MRRYERPLRTALRNGDVVEVITGEKIAVWDAPDLVRHAARPRIHTFIGTSPLHRKYQLQLDAEQVHERVIDSVTRARRYTDDVEWSGMDASRTEPDFLFRCVETAIACGARFEMPMIEGPVTRQVFTMRDDAVGVRIELIERHGEGFDDRPVSELFNAMEARDAW